MWKSISKKLEGRKLDHWSLIKHTCAGWSPKILSNWVVVTGGRDALLRVEGPGTHQAEENLEGSLG